MTLGLIVNPIAGMGGRVGLKGTDGADALAAAHRCGAQPIAPRRTRRALDRLAELTGHLTVIAGTGALGTDLARLHAFETRPAGAATAAQTTAADTRSAAREIVAHGVDLLMFAGGDGTARDIYDAIGDAVPVIGIPTGVKMYSGVFASGPEAAGDTAAAFLSERQPRSVRTAEVADADERAIRAGRITTHLYGTMTVPLEHSRILAAKSSSNTAGDADLRALAAQIAEELDPALLYVVGPGTTTQLVLDHLRLPSTLLGVDAIQAGRLAGRDLDEAGILELLAERPGYILSGVIGGQGFLFGRGNQQISPAVIQRVGVQNITILADSQKLHHISPPWLRIDTGDQEVDASLAGYRRVRVAPSRSIVMRITT